jgi:hypothetical protein
MQLELLPGAVHISMLSYVQKILESLVKALEHHHVLGRKGFFLVSGTLSEITMKNRQFFPTMVLPWWQSYCTWQKGHDWTYLQWRAFYAQE